MNGMAKRRRKRRASVTEQIRRHIDGCGLSRYRIAQLTGVEQAVLSRFMSGERGLSTATLDKLSEVLDLEVVMHGPRES